MEKLKNLGLNVGDVVAHHTINHRNAQQSISRATIVTKLDITSTCFKTKHAGVNALHDESSNAEESDLDERVDCRTMLRHK